MTARKKTDRQSKLSVTRKRRLARKQSNALSFEQLESRQLLAAITVGNNTDILSPTADTSSIAALVANDGGDGISLREAITAANNTTGEDAITFDASVFTGGDNSLIRLTQGELSITDSLSIDGTSVGGVVITGDASGDDITVSGTHITNVSASYGGTAGASDDLLDDNSRVLDFSGSGDLALTGLTITGGRETAIDAGGGGIRFNSSGTLSLDQSTVSGNSTSGRGGEGGGISSFDGDVSLTNSTISGNIGERGGGIYNANGNVSLTESTVSGNSADGNNNYGGLDVNGGGISSSNGNVSVTNSTISGNSGNRGGGISSSNGAVSLTNSTVSGNSSSGQDGGGIYISDGDLSLSNSTVSGNRTVSGSGGGISSANSTVLLVNSTVTNNSNYTGSRDGIVFYANDSAAARLTIHNSIVAGNGPFYTPDLFVFGDVMSDDLVVEYSLIGNTYGSMIDDTTGTGNILDQSALLSPLADYGGATQTHALLRASLAVDAGSNALAVDENGNSLVTDQRGESRVLGTVDIGALELGDRADFETQSLVVNTSQDIANPTDGLTSLREAIEFANDPTVGVNNDGDADGDGSAADTITFDSSVFTGGDNSLIRLTRGQLEISDSLTIDGSTVQEVVITGDADDDDVTVTGTDITDVAASFGGTAGALDDLLDDNSRVLDFTASAGSLTLTDLTITGGRAGESSGSGYGFSDYAAGGGIRASYGGYITLTNSAVSGNSVTGVYRSDGGGIFTGFFGGHVSLTDSIVSGNSTGKDGSGGGIFGGYITLTNSIVTGNSTGEFGSEIENGDGGGIYAGRSATLIDSIVSGNRSNRGGGVFLQFGDISLTNSTVSGNSSGDSGGGISAYSGDVSLTNSAVSGNVAGRSGGGIAADSVLSTNSTVSGNTSGYGGGGISAGDVSLTNSTVSGNVSARDGGGIYSRSGTVSLGNSTVSGNASRSRSGGGGIFSRDGNVSLTTSTVSGNVSDVDGGGIRANGSTVLLVNSTVTGNSAAVAGGGIRFGNSNGNFQNSESLTLNNSIVASNQDDGTAPDISASLSQLTVDHSLIGDTTGFGITAATGPGNILNELPLLGALADNGGPTQTHALLVGSPALDAGSNAIANAAGLTTDQRGEARIEFGTVDIGAFEAGLETRLIVTTSLDVTDETDGLTSLREAIAMANANVGLDAIEFDPSVFDSATTIVIASQLPTITDPLTITGPGANLLTIDAQAGGDDVFDGNGFRIFEVSDGDSSISIDVSISGLTLTGGDISAAGGAISNSENLTLDAVSIVNNQAFAGGGVSNALSGVLSLTNSTIANNQAVLFGGAIFSSNSLAATNVTISGNSTNVNGAAIASFAGASGSTLNLTNVTLTNNLGGSGVYFNNASGATTATFNNTIVGGSVSGLGNGSTLAGSNNLFANSDPGITGLSNLFNQTSLLGPLANNGGPTLTHALLLGSPAYNAGSNALALDENGSLLLTDQRGERRNQFLTVDIGALESEFEGTRSLVVSTSLDVDDPFDGVTSLREAIAFAEDPTAGANRDGDADGDGSAVDTITFDPSVFTGGDSSVIRLTQGELLVSESLRVDGSLVGGVVITGDANDDDVTLPGTHITDVSASFGGTIGASDDFMDDNSRVLDFTPRNGDLTLTGLTITGGSTSGTYSDGGGIRFGSTTYSSSVITLNQSVVSGNSVRGFGSDGGGIAAFGNGAVFLNSSTVSDNYSYGRGGGIESGSGGLSLYNSTVGGNVAGGNGGGVYIAGGDLLLTNSSVYGNSSAEGGGGIYSLASDVFLDDSTVSGNVSSGSAGGLAGGGGGGIYGRTGDVSLNNSTVHGNTSYGAGGGVYTASGNVMSSNSAVSGNFSGGSGGGVGTSFGNVSLVNSTVSGNNAGNYGGGISSGTSSISIVSSTVVDNSASGVGGGISFRNGSFNQNDLLTLQNSIVARNEDNGSAPDVSSVDFQNVLTVENSLLGNTTGSGITSATGVGNFLNQLPLLGPLADNGGQTQTHALLTGSLAINGGSNAIAAVAGLTVDQRGEDRVQFGVVDIGAFESDLSERNFFVTTIQDVEDPDDGLTSLREAITLANESDSIDTILFDANVFGGPATIAISSQLPTINFGLNITGPGANLLTIDAQSGGDNVLDGDGFRIFEVNDGDSNNFVDVSISGLTLTGGDSNDSGGAISNFENLTLDGVSIVGNRAGLGGGISNELASSLTITNSTIANNEASEDGGGIFTGGDLMATNVTISGNSAAGNGGAIVTAGDSSGAMLSLTNATITNNSGNEGLYFDTGNGPAIASFYNTIVDSSITVFGISRTAFAGSNNLFASADPGITGTGNLFNQASMLGSLADNGGPTLTHALLFGSPAINAGDSTLAVGENGNPLTTDQRGEDRIRFGAIDIGAVETRFNELRSLVVTTVQDVVNPGDGLTSLREAIAFAAAGVSGDGDADGDGLTADTITFNSSVFTGGDNSVIRLTQGEFSINHSLTIDGSSVGGVVITGDAAGDDILVAGTHLTDATASLDAATGLDGADGVDLLDDNSRVFDFLDSDLFGAANVTLTGLTITGGRVVGGEDGAGIQFESSGTLTLNQSTVSGNIATGSRADGGGIYASSGDVSLTNSSVTGNISSGNGGGVQFNSRGALAVSQSTISGNIAMGNNANGGGIYARFGDVSLTSSSVTGNVSDDEGGGIYARSIAVSLTGSTVSGNVSARDGGGIRISFGELSLTNSTVSGNTSGRDGGGIWFSDSMIQLVNSTVAGNSASGVGGGISFRNDSFFVADRLTLHNSIVAGNTDNGTAPDVEAVGVVVNDQVVENSLIGDTTGSGITATSGTGNILNQSALLGPLADNGGATQTHALLSGSLAINVGSNAIATAAGLTADQRGESRIQFGTVDIGAFESDFNERNLVVTTSLDVEDPDDGFTSLREAIVISNEGSEISAISFDPALFDVETTITISSQLPTITDALTITGPGANLVTIDALGGGDNALDGNGFRIFEVNDGDSNNSVDVSISGLTLTGGDNNDSGGAIDNFENLTLDGVAIVGNRARFGGGVSNDLVGRLTITNSTIANNEASEDGGGIFTGGELASTNVTISGNNAAGNGGAIVSAGDSSGVMLSLTNSTIANNTGNEGVYFDNGNGPTVASFNNTIIDSSITGVGNNGTTLAGSNNLFASADPGITGTGNLFSQTSMLGLLADNGGPTLTHALLYGSPAINAGDSTLAVDENGNPLATDQRGEDRIRFGAVDIGALETEFDEARSLVVTTAQDVVDVSDGFTSLREAIAFAFAGFSGDGDADGDGVREDAITFDASVFTGGESNVIRLTQGELSISDSLTIDGSSVGGVVITGDAAGDDVLIAGTHVTDVSASVGGTAGTSTNLLDDNSRVLNLFDSDLFGAVNVTLTGLTITGGRVTGDAVGGGVQFDSSGSLTLNQSTVSGNIATGSNADGGGIYARLGDVSFTDSSVTGNISGRDGGGIRIFGGNVSLTSSTVSGNFSGRDGGGVGASFSGVSLTNSTVSGNFSDRDGGGIWFNDSRVLLVNSTVTVNSASGVGGGVSFRNDEFFQADRLTLHNSIVAGNTDNGTAPDVEAVGVVVNDQFVENSLIGDTTGSGITATSGTGNILNQSALLGPLADNGGSTLTHALLPGSPAIDAGSNALALDENGNPVTADQRGEDRVQFGTVDIGAVESEFEDPFLLGDANLDSVVNFLDISPFISLLSSGTFLDEADIDRNGVVNFLDISPFISVLSSGGSADPFLLGDANLDSVVNFLDISPFISLLSGGTFLDEADINRDGNVDFLDISPFISVLSFGGSAPSNLVASNLEAPAIASGSAVTSQSIVVGSPVSSVESLVSVSRPASVTSAVEVSIATVTSDAIDGDAATLASTVSQDVTATTALPQVSLVLVNDSLASPVNQASDLPVVGAIEAGVTLIDTFIGPVAFRPTPYSFLWAGDSSLRGAESNGSLVTRRSLVWDAQWFDLPREARDKHLVPNVSAEESFSTAAELFDAHPESLDEIFDFELEETLAGLI